MYFYGDTWFLGQCGMVELDLPGHCGGGEKHGAQGVRVVAAGECFEGARQLLLRGRRPRVPDAHRALGAGTTATGP